MKTLKDLKKVFLGVLTLCVAAGFTACSSDDDDPVNMPVKMSIQGTYEGTYKVQTTLDPGLNEKPGDETTEEATPNSRLVVDSKNLELGDFPIAFALKGIELVGEEKSDVVDEDETTDVLEEIKKDFENVELAYTLGSVNEKKGTALFSIAFEEYTKELKNGSTLVININEVNEGKYVDSEETGTLTMNLEVDVKVLENEEAEEPADEKKDADKEEPASFKTKYAINFVKISR